MEPVMSAACQIAPTIVGKQFLDDVVQSCRGTEIDVMGALPIAVEEFVRQIAVQQLQVSSEKSCVVASSVVLGRRVCNAIAARCNLRLPLRRSTRDLGVDHAAGARRATREARGSKAKAQQRVSRAKLLGLSRRVRIRLLRTGAQPQQVYHVAVWGMSSSELVRARALAHKAAVAGNTAGRCCTTDIHMCMGAEVDPAVHQVLRMSREWL
eukprot:2445342-Amphidinium_carterae.1